MQGPWISRQALHAASLTLQHPCTGEAMQLIGKCLLISGFHAPKLLVMSTAGMKCLILNVLDVC